jgi:hypothetical protein
MVRSRRLNLIPGLSGSNRSQSPRRGFRLKGGIGDLRTGRSGVCEPGLRPNIGVRDPRARPAASDSIGESPGMAKGMDRREERSVVAFKILSFRSNFSLNLNDLPLP